MGGLNLDKLYDNYNILSDAKEKVSEVGFVYTDCCLSIFNTKCV